VAMSLLSGSFESRQRERVVAGEASHNTLTLATFE